MRNSTIYAVAAVCGLGAFIYKLAVGGPTSREGVIRGQMRSFMPNGVGDLPTTIPQLEELVLSHPRPGREGRAWVLLAKLYRDDGQEAAELDAWRHAAPLRRDSAQNLNASNRHVEEADAWFDAGYGYRRIGLAADAKDALTHAEDLLTQLARSTDDPEDWYRLGWSRKLLGNEAEGRIAWARAIDRLPPKESPSAGPRELYNLACYRALMGERDEALDVLERAILSGYHDARHAEHDEDFDSIRDDPRFAEALLHMRQADVGVRIERGP